VLERRLVEEAGDLLADQGKRRTFRMEALADVEGHLGRREGKASSGSAGSRLRRRFRIATVGIGQVLRRGAPRPRREIARQLRIV
jgi:hypothetical protein